jgi:hypothetical protein
MFSTDSQILHRVFHSSLSLRLAPPEFLIDHHRENAGDLQNHSARRLSIIRIEFATRKYPVPHVQESVERIPPRKVVERSAWLDHGRTAGLSSIATSTESGVAAMHSMFVQRVLSVSSHEHTKIFPRRVKVHARSSVQPQTRHLWKSGIEF